MQYPKGAYVLQTWSKLPKKSLVPGFEPRTSVVFQHRKPGRLFYIASRGIACEKMETEFSLSFAPISIPLKEYKRRGVNISRPVEPCFIVTYGSRYSPGTLVVRAYEIRGYTQARSLYRESLPVVLSDLPRVVPLLCDGRLQPAHLRNFPFFLAPVFHYSFVHWSLLGNLSGHSRLRRGWF